MLADLEKELLRGTTFYPALCCNYRIRDRLDLYLLYQSRLIPML